MTSNDRQTTRRTALRNTAAAAAAAGLTLTAAGCRPGRKGPGSDPATPTAPVGLGSPDAVPVGGAKLFREQRLVVSQPERGQFKAFSAVCTHQGCVLTEVRGEAGDCPCHGSRFDVSTGKVLRGPAREPLPEASVREEQGRLVAGPPEGEEGSGRSPDSGRSGRSGGTEGARGSHTGAG